MPSKKPRDHYLPAAFIARFSPSPRRQMRESLVWARNRGIGVPFLEKAANLGYVRGLYAAASESAAKDEYPPAMDVDAAWRKIEGRLSPAIDALIESRNVLDARIFGEVLVPFIASLFVRGWEFNQRFVARMDHLFGPDSDLHARATSPENINNARLLELQRLFSPIMRARWTVLTNVSDVSLITSDLGAFPWAARSWQGVAVPLDPHHAVVLEPRPACPRIAFGVDQWLVDVHSGEISRTEVVRANRLCSRVAPRQIYGPEEASVLSQQVEMAQRKPVDLPEGAWGLSGRYLARTDVELMDFLIETTQPPHQTPRISREEAVGLLNWPLPVIALGTNKDSIFSEVEDTRLRLDEMTERKAELDRLSNRFGAMEVLAAPER